MAPIPLLLALIFPSCAFTKSKSNATTFSFWFGIRAHLKGRKDIKNILFWDSFILEFSISLGTISFTYPWYTTNDKAKPIGIDNQRCRPKWFHSIFVIRTKHVPAKVRYLDEYTNHLFSHILKDEKTQNFLTIFLIN